MVSSYFLRNVPIPKYLHLCTITHQIPFIYFIGYIKELYIALARYLVESFTLILVHRGDNYWTSLVHPDSVPQHPGGHSRLHPLTN